LPLEVTEVKKDFALPHHLLTIAGDQWHVT